jgi:serine/threonine-protein kinase
VRTRADPQLLPRHIGEYEILMPIASGGMGTVYLAHARAGDQRQVAVKTIHAHLREEQQLASDLVAEGRLAARIRHPNVVEILEVGVDAHGVFLAMEYIEGSSLAGLMWSSDDRTREVPSTVGLRILTDALAGLHAAHELRDDDGAPLGMVHRDFSPHNILVGVDGRARLGDFGIAKIRARSGHTRTGIVKGKVHYMSPEQARGETLDRRCDVWAAGVIAWELLAKRRLYPSMDDTAVLLALVGEMPPRLRRVRPELPAALDDAVASALSPSLGARCPTADRFASALVNAADGVGGLAGRDEVAAFVRAHASGTLAKRREDLAAAIALHEHVARAKNTVTIARPVSQDLAGMVTPDHRAHADTASLQGDPVVQTLPWPRRRPKRRSYSLIIAAALFLLASLVWLATAWR